ncbi:alpha/beta-Hydrolases superfamily protein [Actinidia rufa]|uniref:Alpha/beta-Hydrolases superfamily protein n=1 Tax=Actinidia rufa TaxID=165716 RepID=A0A7J0GS12_9ERIC|nr:alpha/beta-Hydrolases superfamily protein [Actinidia rufa]
MSKKGKDKSQIPVLPEVDNNVNYDSWIRKYSSSDDDDDLSDNRWKLELAWLTKALESALQLCRRVLPTQNGFETNHLLAVDLLWRLLQAFSGVQDLIYRIELANGAYRDNTAGLARNSMLRESNVVKFIKDSSVMRPEYYIGIDARKKPVILGIRGTHTVSEPITGIISSSHEGVTFEGYYSTHFGTAESARWFLNHEMGTIRSVWINTRVRLIHLQGFRLRLVGHSFERATASLLAITLRKKSSKELGFSPDIVTSIGYVCHPTLCILRTCRMLL